MVIMNWYPPASRIQPRSYGIMMPKIDKLLLHTTESSGWPGYPSFAPTLTYDPWQHAWRQHMPILGSASTLSNAGAFRTNRDNVCQVEIVGYCDERRKGTGRFIGDIDQQAINDLGAFASWLRDHHGLELRNGVDWKPYNSGQIPSSYGTNNGVRLSVGNYRSYRGLLGHMHAPGNDHGDPGVLDVDAILDAATGQDFAPQEEVEDDMSKIISRYSHWRNETMHLARPDTWQTMKIANDSDDGNEMDVIQGPTTIIAGTVYVIISGLALDNSVWIRPYAVVTNEGKGTNERGTEGDDVKIDGSHDGWVRTTFSYDWLLGDAPVSSKGRFLRFEWKSDTTDAKIRKVTVSGTEMRDE